MYYSDEFFVVFFVDVCFCKVYGVYICKMMHVAMMIMVMNFLLYFL